MEIKEDQDSNDWVDLLFEMAMQGHWDMSDELSDMISKNYDIASDKREIAKLGVVKAYTILSDMISKNYDIASARRETALHVAVAAANEETEHVSEIIRGIREPDLSKILRMRNCMGNTPLHLAAAMGKTDICWLIASKDKSLIEEKNEQGETPLFLAAHYGHEDAFFYLEYEFRKTDVNMLKNNSGNTVLHSAISGQDYRLAIRILQWYPALANEQNEKRLTPLHVLALQHRSFESSTVGQLGLFDRIFYKCMIIRKETWVDRENTDDIEEIDSNRKSPKYPKNYRTCFDIYEMLKEFFGKTRALLKSCRGCDASGEEIDRDTSSLEEGNGKYVRKKEKGYTEKRGPSTTICDLVFQIFKYMSFVPLHFLVSERLLSIAKRKRKHKLAEQLLDELLDKTCKVAIAKEESTSPPRTDAPIRINLELLKEQGHVETIRIQLDKTCSCKVTVEEKSTPTPSTSKTMTDASTQGQGNGQSVTTTSPSPGKKEEQSSEPCVRGETPLLTAARLGIEEMVEAILDKFPKAIEDKDRSGKNAVLLAVEHRRSRVFRLLHKMTMVKESVFCQVDTEGNSALHLASRYNPERPWFTPGPALQMKWEITWHEYVRNLVPLNTFAHRNNDGKTAREIFIQSHKDLKKEAQDWLKNACTAYSLISTLIATVAFATSSTIPGDYDNGKPALEPEFAFSVFSIFSLIALCTSMSATVFFVAVLVTRHEQEDFAEKVPSRLQSGLTFLFASIASILVSFSSGYYFSVRNKLENAAYPIFAAMCLPVTLFGIAQLPLYFGLTRDIFFNPKDKIQHYDHDIDTH